MKVKIILPLMSVIIFVFGFNAVNAQGTTKSNPKPPNRTISGEGFVYKMSDDDFADTPSINLEENEPPISATKAIKIARENLPRFVKGTETWKVAGIRMESAREDKWFYIVSFRCAGIECREATQRSYVIVVKMDGTIVEPKKVTIEQ